MFDKLRALFGGSPSGEPPRAGPQLAMPLLPTAAPLDPVRIARAAADLGARVAPGNAPSEGVLSFSGEGGQVLVTHLPMPVPGDEAVAAVRRSWMWQRGDEEVRAHAAHALITALPGGDPVREARLVSQVAGAVLEAGGGPALYWGAAGQVIPAELVRGFLEEAGSLPVPLWVGLTASAPGREGPWSVATHGLEAFGSLEFEVLEARTPLGRLRTSLLDLAASVLEQGVKLGDGETFGPDAQTRWTIHRRPSALVPGRTALVLGIP